jgi:hypothetical protein
MKVYGFAGQPSRNNRGPDALLLRALNRRLTRTDLGLFFAGVSSDGVEGFMLSRLLRLLVDAWINSGRIGDGEYPWRRQPWREPIQDYIERNPPKLNFTKDGPSLFVGPPLIGHKYRKGVSWFATYVEEGLTQLPDTRAPDAKLRKVLRSAADPATALYLQLLDSPIPARLFRCDGCATYLMRARAPKRNAPIHRGSWCAKCKGKGGARRTGKSRKNRRDQMIEWAADAWTRWKQDGRHGERVEWVVQQVNEQLKSSEDQIKKNWVSLHLKEIEAEVQRRKHAKG